VTHVIWKDTKESHDSLDVPCGALSWWGQQVGFLPSRDDAFYNEKVKEIIMKINSWTAVACELYQPELCISRAVLQCRTKTGKSDHSSLLGSELNNFHTTPHNLFNVCIFACVCTFLCVCVCLCVIACVWIFLSPDAYRWPINQLIYWTK
jgi:hypothetical protein